MKLEITTIKSPNGQEVYEFCLSDGPDDKERVHGYSTDLILAFTKVLEWKERINRDYSSVNELPEGSVDYTIG